MFRPELMTPPACGLQDTAPADPRWRDARRFKPRPRQRAQSTEIRLALFGVGERPLKVVDSALTIESTRYTTI
jgi:hypothetical protein